MNNKRTTKRALLTSVMALVMCVVMLVGTTFAWFTDTASTAVNKIQSGTLKVDIVNAAGDSSLDGKTLEFKNENGSTNILWEPGATFKTDSFKIKNEGSLAIKYKLALNGTTGDTGLLKVIEFSVVNEGSGAKLPLDSFEGNLAAGESGNLSDAYYIQGYMDKEAGNEYQNKSLEGIGITVYATQLNSEADSTGTDYDENAEYNYKSATIMNNDGGETTTLESGKTYTVGTATVAVNGNDITYTSNGEGASAQTVTITTEGGRLTVDAPNDTIYHYGEAEFVDVNAVDSNSYHEFGKVAVLSVTKGRVVIENGNNVKVLQVKAASDDTTDAANPIVAVPEDVVLETELQIASDTTVKVAVINNEGAVIEAKSQDIQKGSTEFASVPAELVKVLSSTLGFAEPATYVATVNGEPYESLTDAITKAGAGDTIVLGNDIKTNSIGNITCSLTIDLNNKTLTYTGSGSILVKEKNTVFTLKNGTFESASVQGTGTRAAATVICNEANTTTTLIGVKAAAAQAFLYPAGDTSAVNVINSEITAGVYGVATNAGKGNKTGIKINIENSTITATSENGDNCAVLMNVGGTLTITDSTITGDRQGVFVRAGKAEIKNSTIKTTGKFGDDNYSGKNGYWGSGNEAPRGALLLGSYDDGSAYQAAVECTLYYSTLVAENNANRIVGCDRENYKVTLCDTYPWTYSNGDPWTTDEKGVEYLK